MQLIAQKEAAEFVKTGAKEFRQNSEVRLTPGAKDIFTEAGVKVVFDSTAAPASTPAPTAPNPAQKPAPTVSHLQAVVAPAPASAA